MKRGRASLTATAVAWARAIGTEASIADPTAVFLLFDRKIDDPRARLGAYPVNAMRLLLRMGSLGLVDHVNLRTRAIDTIVAQALQQNRSQLVVLGAGLDGRAWRLDGLEGVDVYELDHPETQAVKRQRAAGIAPAAAQLTFVPIDFERQSLRVSLDEAGHDPSKATVWIWEGVSPYLSQAVNERTIHEIADCSASGSILIMTYITPASGPWLWSKLVGGASVAFRLLQEPIECIMQPNELAEILGRECFELIDDSGSNQWGKDLPLARHLSRLFASERLATAKRKDEQPARPE